MRIFALHSFLCWNTDGYQQKLKTMFIFHIPQKVFTYKQDYYSVRIRLFEIRPLCILCAFPCNHIWWLHIPQSLVTERRPQITLVYLGITLQLLNNITHVKYSVHLFIKYLFFILFYIFPFSPRFSRFFGAKEILQRLRLKIFLIVLKTSSCHQRF